MACFTVVQVTLDDNRLNRKARKNLKLPLEGTLSQYDANRVAAEGKILKAIERVRALQPSAIITRKGDKVTVKVSV